MIKLASKTIGKRMNVMKEQRKIFLKWYMCMMVHTYIKAHFNNSKPSIYQNIKFTTINIPIDMHS